MTPRGDRRSGFTMIETLVALIVFAMVAVVAQRGMVTARLGLDRVRSTLAAEQVARSIVETELVRLVRGPGEFAGETGGLAWTIVATPIVLPLPPASPARAGAAGAASDGGANRQAGGDAAEQDQAGRWRLLRVVVTVANGRGRPLVVETVHAAKDVS